MKNRSWKMVWLPLLWLPGCLALSPQAEAEKCFLYPVQEGQCSPDFLLKENKDTVITVNNIDFKKKGLSSIYLNHRQCIVQLAYNGAPSTGRCHTLNTSDEYAHLYIRRLDEGVRVWWEDSPMDEVKVPVNLTGQATLSVNASSSNINVAYDCPNECFQFEKATIHKSFGNDMQGSLLFYGKVKPGEGDRGYIDIIRGSRGWNMQTRVKLSTVTARNPAWNTFNVSMTLEKQKNYYLGKFSMHYNPSRKALLETKTFPFPSPDLYVRFGNTSNMRWAITCSPRATSLAPPGEPSSPTATPTPITTHLQDPASTSFEIPDYLREGKVPVWWLVVLGAGCGLLLLLLTTYICRRHKPPSEADVPTTFQNPLAASQTQNDDDLPDHEYDYIDINQLRMCAGQSQTASTDQQDRRKSHNSINSIYGWDEKDSI